MKPSKSKKLKPTKLIIAPEDAQQVANLINAHSEALTFALRKGEVNLRTVTSLTRTLKRTIEDSNLLASKGTKTEILGLGFVKAVASSLVWKAEKFIESCEGF
jgi:hypothetical protein